jgi:hypothetical protein
MWVHSSASVQWTPAPVSDSASAFGPLRPYGCRGFRTLSTRVEYPISSNKSWDYDCSVFRRFSAATRVSVFSSTYTDFRVFANSHGFPCHMDFRVFVSSTSPRRHTEIRVFQKHTESRPARNFVFFATHGILYHTKFRVFVFSPSHEVPSTCLMCGPADDPVHAPLFTLCVTSTLLVGICPSQLPCCRGIGASSASFPSAWASVDSASLNHTSVHRLSPNDFR